MNSYMNLVLIGKLIKIRDQDLFPQSTFVKPLRRPPSQRKAIDHKNDAGGELTAIRCSRWDLISHPEGPEEVQWSEYSAEHQTKIDKTCSVKMLPLSFQANAGEQAERGRIEAAFDSCGDCYGSSRIEHCDEI